MYRSEIYVLVPVPVEILYVVRMQQYATYQLRDEGLIDKKVGLKKSDFFSRKKKVGNDKSRSNFSHFMKFKHF